MQIATSPQSTGSRVCQGCPLDLPVGCSPKRQFCDACQKRREVERVARWREANPDKFAVQRERELPAARVRAKARYAADPEKAKAEHKAWAQANRPKMNAYRAEWLLKPGNKAKAASWTSAWMKAHPEKVRAYYKRWAIENHEALRALKAGRSAKYAASNFKFDDWLVILDVFGHCCAYCLRNDRPLTMDHIIAISRGGKHEADNIVPSCRSCNSKKGDRPVLFMAAKG